MNRLPFEHRSVSTVSTARLVPLLRRRTSGRCGVSRTLVRSYARLGCTIGTGALAGCTATASVTEIALRSKARPPISHTIQSYSPKDSGTSKFVIVYVYISVQMLSPRLRRSSQVQQSE